MSVTAAAGFVAAGGSVGIKAAGVSDVAIVATADGQPVAAAGVFTSNSPPRSGAAQPESPGCNARTRRRCDLTSGNANAATVSPASRLRPDYVN